MMLACRTKQMGRFHAIRHQRLIVHQQLLLPGNYHHFDIEDISTADGIGHYIGLHKA